MKQYFTTGEAARICCVHINTVKGWVRRGDIEAVISPGGRWRIVGTSLLRFLQTNGMSVPIELQERLYKILVVDDDPAVCELVRSAMKLSLLPCEVSCVGDGYSGLIRVGDLKPDLMILDIMMPDINGLEVMRRLRENPVLVENMRIVVLTGAQDSSLVLKNIKAAKPDATLFKPVSIVQLLETIQGLLAPNQPSEPKQYSEGYRG
ncbi:response regulator [Ghiorsea bivora]|uniref:response regulator n=1 Tax=Ghiorsea bivora TaxID=1485545 RepID=UPI0006901F34|nr:response regulator [Ghiorsea bivora]